MNTAENTKTSMHEDTLDVTGRKIMPIAFTLIDGDLVHVFALEDTEDDRRFFFARENVDRPVTLLTVEEIKPALIAAGADEKRLQSITDIQIDLYINGPFDLRDK